jgi:hypothetical protein
LETPKRQPGVTEKLWFCLPEDQKLFWRFFVGLCAFLSARIVPKTGIEWLDHSLFFCCWFISLLLIEWQRNRSKFSRAGTRRIAVFSYASILLLWASFILLVFLYVVAQFGLANYKSLQSELRAIPPNRILFFIPIYLGSFFALGFAATKAFRGLAIYELAFKGPKFVMIKYYSLHSEVKLPKWVLSLELLVVGYSYGAFWVVSDIVRKFSVLEF